MCHQHNKNNLTQIIGYCVIQMRKTIIKIVASTPNHPSDNAVSALNVT